jgi:hypothetical protein
MFPRAGADSFIVVILRELVSRKSSSTFAHAVVERISIHRPGALRLASPKKDKQVNPLFVNFLAGLGGTCIVSFVLCALFMARVAAVSVNETAAPKNRCRRRRRRSDKLASQMNTGRTASRAAWI